MVGETLREILNENNLEDFRMIEDFTKQLADKFFNVPEILQQAKGNTGFMQKLGYIAEVATEYAERKKINNQSLNELTSKLQDWLEKTRPAETVHFTKSSKGNVGKYIAQTLTEKAKKWNVFSNYKVEDLGKYLQTA